MLLKFISTLVVILSTTPFAHAERTMRGIRNQKCAPSENDAKIELTTQLAKDAKLCENGWSAVQAGGWSCKRFDCKKGNFRCNTQYVCEARALDISPTPIASPTNVAATVQPEGKLEKPEPMPNVKASAAAIKVEDAVIRRKEVKDGDTIYVQETKIGKDGAPITTVVPKKDGVKTIEVIPEEEKSRPVASPTAEAAVLPSSTSGDSAGEKFYSSISACEKASWTIPRKGNQPSIRHEVVGNIGGKCKVVRADEEHGTWTCLFSKVELDLIGKLKSLALTDGDPFSKFLQDEKICPMTPP